MKNILVGVIIIAAVAAGVYFYNQRNQNQEGVFPTENPFSSSAISTSPISGKGEVVFVVADKSVDLQGVSEVELTASRMELYSAGSGWVAVSGQAKTYNLLQLKSSDQLSLAGRADIDSGTYNQVRLTIDKVVVQTKNGARLTANVPSNTFAVANTVVVNSGETATVKLDFNVAESLHTTVSNEYVFAPVVEVEARSNADVAVGSNNIVSISGGSVSSDIKAGMDLNGEVKINFKLDAGAVIKLEGGVLELNL
ncbi:MAG: DUF4382 domain-containing protein [Candidatus Pacebacteria bacterium]|nr:DUF4382 domain-containing protein [Candidatus Paceibacterota bacterium]NUQ57108.1 DUF4382 domain-containing protein [Candidatus Paceibacter sp.]